MDKGSKVPKMQGCKPQDRKDVLLVEDWQMSRRKLCFLHLPSRTLQASCLGKLNLIIDLTLQDEV